MIKFLAFSLILFSLNAQGVTYEIGKPATPYDRGNTPEDLAKSYGLARDEVLNTYFEGCGAPKSIGTCVYINPAKLAASLFTKGWSIEPHWEYYLPVSVVETDEKPFATAFHTKEEIKLILENTEKALYPTSNVWVGAGIQTETNPRTSRLGFSIDDIVIGNDFKEIIQKFDSFKRFRNPNQHSDGYRHMNAHVIGLDFEAIFRDHVLFNSIDGKDAGYEGEGGDPFRPLTWSHHHAKYGNGDKTGMTKNANTPFPPTQLGEKLMFEEPLAVNFSQYAAPVRMLFGGEMHQAGAAQGCMGRSIKIFKQALSGGDKVNYNELRNGFIEPEKIYTMDDSDTLCLPGVLGDKFAGPLSVMKTIYAIDAGNIANYRGLRLAANEKVGNAKYGDPSSFYQLQEMDAPPRKRDKIQYLGQLIRGKNYRGRIGKKYPGCQNWDLNKHFIPEILNEGQYMFGPNWDDLNHNYEAEGERFLAVHWRYLAGCRRPKYEQGEEFLIPPDPKKSFYE